MLHVSGTTTATQSAFPIVNVTGMTGSRLIAGHLIHLSHLNPNQSASWTASLRERQSVSGCEVMTFVIDISPQGP
jgi:hypothetical protein